MRGTISIKLIAIRHIKCFKLKYNFILYFYIRVEVRFDWFQRWKKKIKINSSVTLLKRVSSCLKAFQRIRSKRRRIKKKKPLLLNLLISSMINMDFWAIFMSAKLQLIRFNSNQLNIFIKQWNLREPRNLKS